MAAPASGLAAPHGALRFSRILNASWPAPGRGARAAVPVMMPFVFAQGGWLGKGAAAVRVRAEAGLVAGVDPCVRFQIVALGKGTSTALPGADKGFLPRVDPVVHLAVAAAGKVESTVIEKAGIRLFPRMHPLVPSQQAGLCESASAVTDAADKRPCAALHPLVSVQQVGLPESALTVIVRAGKGAAGGRRSARCAQGCRQGTATAMVMVHDALSCLAIRHLRPTPGTGPCQGLFFPVHPLVFVQQTGPYK